MPLQVMTVETRTKQTEVVELETPEDRGSRSYKESGGHVFTEHLEGQSYLDIYVAKLKSDGLIMIRSLGRYICKNFNLSSCYCA